MKADISVSLARRGLLEQEIAAIVGILTKFEISSFVFVDHYKFDKTQERELMKQAMKDIDYSDILIAETSDKGVGIGVEAGYAKANGKKVIYLRQQDAEHSTTVSGISDFQIIYHSTDDLQKQLAICCERLVK